MVGRGTPQIRLLISIVQLLIAGISNATNSQQPAVLLPSVFHWDANNVVFVTPIAELARDESVDISLRVQGENGHGEKSELFSETARSAKGTHAFKVAVPRLDAKGQPLHNFYLTIRVSGHQTFSTVLAGASDLRQIHLQTDKVFYRPEERVNIRALPLTSTGQVFKGLVQFQLLDPNGFRIFNKTNNQNLLASDANVRLVDEETEGSAHQDEQQEKRHRVGFIAEHFDLPKFLRFGDWRILVFAVDSEDMGKSSSSRFQTIIRVQEYKIPKFYVFLELDAIDGDSPLAVEAKVFARFAHGMAVNGELTIRCHLATSNGANISGTGNSGIDQMPPNVMRKLLSAQLSDGQWSGRIDLSACAGSQHQQKVHVLAEVFERSTFQTGSTSREWDPFAPGFEMIPLRPAYTENTRKLQIYLRLLSTLESGRQQRVELISQCISDDRSLNGLNHSLVQRLGTIVELETDGRCLAYLLWARRKLPDGSFSAPETLVLSLLRGAQSLDFSLIEIGPNRVDYVEGEVLEANVVALTPGQKWDYALLCGNGREVVAVDRVPTNGRILLPITARMRTGPCVLYVFGQNARGSGMALDMRLLFVRTGECPSEHFGMSVPRANQSVGAPVNVTLMAAPNSLALLHAYDSRLEALLKPSVALSPSNGQLWTFTEFLNPDPDERTTESFAWFSNLLDLSLLFAKRKATCREAGRLVPQCPDEGELRQKAAASKFSEDCLRELKEECERQKSISDSAHPFLKEKGTPEQTTQSSTETRDPKVMLSGQMFSLMRRPAPIREPPNNKELDDLKALRSGEKSPATPTESEMVLREFFPEVWLFEDFQFGASGKKELHLKTPHSVTEWRFAAKFWSSRRADVCRVPSESLLVQKDVFMEVEVFSHIYVNETVPVTVTVSAERLDESGKRMAVCFRGLSPAVCGDLGRDGAVGEADFTRIELTRQNPIQQKQFFVRFLRPGVHNLSFELRAEEILKGHEWHCRDGNLQVFDRIVRQIKVSRRVDMEEHFRQIVIYQRRKITGPTLEQVLGDESPETTPASTAQTQHFWTLQSSPDVISYSQQQPLDYQEGDQQAEGDPWLPVKTQVQINTGGQRVFGLGVEFSKFVASFPPALSAELLAVTSPLAQPGQFQRVRNRPALNAMLPLERAQRSVVGGGKRKKGGRRKKLAAVAEENRIADDRPLQGFSLPNLLKELAQTSYELKSLRAMLAAEGSELAEDEAGILLERLDRDWLEARESRLGALLAELLTFSDCTGRANIACGFGEFTKPKSVAERNLVLSTLATSLLCEQRASEEFVCGPVNFLAAQVERLLNGSAFPTLDGEDSWGLDSFVQFSNPTDRRLFMEAMLVQLALDCSAYSCSAEAWRRLHSSFYRIIDLHARYDVRVVAALAYMSTAATRSLMRAKLASRTRDDEQVPFWTVQDSSAGTKQDLLQKSFHKAGNVLLNALALLAYTRNQSIYRYWRNELDLEALSNWLVEQQDKDRQYENALDTFFASRALHQYAAVNAQRQLRLALSGTINANFTVRTAIAAAASSHQHFSDAELPFVMAVPPSANQMELDTRGQSRLMMGVRVLLEKRKRSRRDPNDGEPISLKLHQQRTQQGFLNQTVTIRIHSHLLHSLQIEHGIFTGFSSQQHFVHLLSGPAFFQFEPRISPTAVHFVLSGLSRDLTVVYSVTLVEPDGGYSTERLAPVAITAYHHHLPLGQLIVQPEETDFLLNNKGIQASAQRNQRSISPGGRQLLLNPSPAAVAPPPAHFQMASSFLTQIDNVQPSNQAPDTQQQQFQKLVTERTRQSQSEQVVETVCLPNGACTCAELSCTVKCTACDRLRFEDLCKEMSNHQGHRFSVFFRINKSPTVARNVSVGSTQYLVLENVFTMEWKSAKAEKPEQLTIWIRHCNTYCLRMFEQRGKEIPRFLLIGDPIGLFDESDGTNELSDGQQQEGNKITGEGIRTNSKLLQTHYLMRDDDRLIRSTDCQELFGKLSDEQCAEPIE